MPNNEKDSNATVKQRAVLILLAVAILICVAVCFVFWVDELNHPIPSTVLMHLGAVINDIVCMSKTFDK